MAYPWIKGFLDWLKRLLTGKSDLEPSVQILEEYHTDRVSVFRLKNDSPGCCDFWKIDNRDEQTTFWICCLNLGKLRDDLAELRTSPDAYLRSHHRGMASSIEQQLAEQSDLISTHLWIAGTTKPYSSVDPKGRSFKSFRTTSINIVSGDFQGAAGYYAGDRHIQRFARQIAERVANCEFREYRYHSSWGAAVKAIDWAGWLEGLAQGINGIDPNHRLQVRRSKTLRKAKK